MRTVRGMVLIALVCATSLMVSSPAFAQANRPAAPAPQQDSDQGIGIGALGGLNIAIPTGEDAEIAKSGTGWIVGIWFGGNRNGRVGFMGELNFAEKKIVDRKSVV